MNFFFMGTPSQAIWAVASLLTSISFLGSSFVRYLRPCPVPNGWVKFGIPVLAALDLALIVFDENVFSPNALLYGWSDCDRPCHSNLLLSSLRRRQRHISQGAR
jgi:hypothetical protein